MAETIQKKMIVEEFFDWQLLQDRNYELVDGVPVLHRRPPSGSSDDRDAIVVNLLAGLSRRLAGTPCRPRTRGRAIRTPTGLRHSDVVIECGCPEPDTIEISEPRVVFDVISPWTATFEDIRKIGDYQRQPSIRAIVMIDAEAPGALVWRSSPQSWSSAQVTGLDSIVGLPEIGVTLPLAELYNGIEFKTT